MNFKKNNKGLSGIVATLTLLAVVGIAVVNFESWFGSLQSGLLADTEQRGDVDFDFEIQDFIIDDVLYIKSEGGNSLYDIKIEDGNGNQKCSISDGTESSFQSDNKLLLNFDDGTATDLSGNDKHGTLMEGLNCNAEGISGKGCEFDGLNDHISINSGQGFNFSSNSSFTISLWFKTEDDICNPCRIIRHNDNSGYQLFVHSGKIQWSVLDGITGTTNMKKSGIADNKFHNVVGIYDNGYAKMYVDNIFINDTNFNMVPTTSDEFRIGTYIGEEEFFNGTIDEIAIYSKALTDEEVNALYKSQKAKFYEQLLPKGLKAINVSSCSLSSGVPYKIIIGNKDTVVEKTVINK